jgi:RND superfamily putative drug exporter
MALIVLVAVGADYNLLLISRIRDEAKYGVRSAVIRTIGATGGVITSAGLIFAASMLALTVSSVLTAVQIGFVVGIGLLLDTFLVRTVTVPAMCVIAGDANWWPSKPPRVKLEQAKLAEANSLVKAPVAVLERNEGDTDELAGPDGVSAVLPEPEEVTEESPAEIEPKRDED